MALERYREKRNFKATPEPRGGPLRKKKQGLSFVIQKHAASHLHYDFRLELNGVLLSWAVPKGPSLDPADKRLAMQVEDHPLEYGGFEGTIPAKQYGGGTVLLWDRGIWIPQGDAATAYEKGHLKFELVGQKLRGGWMLVRTHGSKYGNGNKKAWLLIKETDEFARRGVDARIVDAEPDSVASGRSLDQIANDREHVWHSNRSVQANVAAGAVESKAKKTRAPASSDGIAVSALEGVRKSALPAMLTPKLAMLVDAIPQGDGWLHEIKYDGYRMVCRIDRGKVRVYSRNGKDWTDALPQIAAAAARLPVKSAWIDGEVAVLLPDGRTSFQKLQNALSEAKPADLTYFVFDVPFVDGYDLRAVPLLARKRLLRQIVPEADATLRLGVEVQGSGDQVFAQLCKLGFEGAVSKKVDSTYQEGVRNREWVKVKCSLRQEMVIGGFTDPQGGRSGFGALLLGVYERDGTLRYSGKVGTGFNDRLLVSLRKQLDKLEQNTPPFANPPRGYEARGAHWVKPTLVGEVSFTEWTEDGTLRHPSFEGLRADKRATDVVREWPADAEAEPMPKTKAAHAAKQTPSAGVRARTTAKAAASKADPSPAPRGSPPGSTPGQSGKTTVAGVTLTHPDKLLFPEAGLTKRDLAEYYAKVSEWMVPHLRGRPLSLVRCPDGWKAQCFYHKHADKSVNAAVSRVQVPEGGGTSTYMSADSVTAVVGLLQWGVAEMHPWGSRVPRLDRPDRLIFDFDPDDGVSWSELVSAVQVLRTLLDKVGLRGFLKTTGGKGLHVVLPIRATLEWPEAKAFTKSVADFLVSTFPDRFVATLSKAQRKGRIFIDYLRNAEGATAIAPYSVRARSNAPVAMPIAWEELRSDVRFDHFNVKNALARLTRMKKDPWADFFDVRQSITQAAIKKLG